MKYNDPAKYSDSTLWMRRLIHQRRERFIMTCAERRILRPEWLKIKDENVVYLVECIENGRKYIGSTEQSLSFRMSGFFSKLRSGRHPNSVLLADFAKFGISKFKVSILEHCTPLTLRTRERYLIKQMSPVYNMIFVQVLKRSKQNIPWSVVKQALSKLEGKITRSTNLRK